MNQIPQNILDEYSNVQKPKWWEWIPFLAISYDRRMGAFLRTLPVGDMLKEEVSNTFSRVGAYTFGLIFIIIILTPAIQVFLNKKIYKKLSINYL